MGGYCGALVKKLMLHTFHSCRKSIFTRCPIINNLLSDKTKLKTSSLVRDNVILIGVVARYEECYFYFNPTPYCVNNLYVFQCIHGAFWQLEEIKNDLRPMNLCLFFSLKISLLVCTCLLDSRSAYIYIYI